MRDREAFPAATAAGPQPGVALRDVADWQSVGSALAASIVIHVFAFATLGALLLSPVAAPPSSNPPTPLFAVLVGVVQLDRSSESPPAPIPSSVSPARASVPAPAPNRREAGAVLPWSGTSPEIYLPPGMSGTAMVSEGLEYLETRNIVRLGVDIERRIRADYPDEPEYPAVLKSAVTLGYPLDALAAGIEGVVLVWFGVDEEGKVIAKEVLDGPPELSAWVLDRVDRLVARPAWSRDGPVRTWVALEVHFSRAEAMEARATAERK